MNYYEFVANDQMWNTWLIFSETGDDPARVKSRYKHLLCTKCGKFHHDEVFKEGFDPDMRIRGRGDIIATCDGFHCFNEVVKSIIETEHYGGIALQSVANTGWYVSNIKFRVKADPAALELHNPICRQCKRAAEVTGLFDYQSQIKVPTKAKSFFTTVADRHCSGYFDRPIFVTEDIVVQFKKAGVKGGMFRRLLNSEEEAAEKRTIASGKQPRWPANSKVLL